MGRASLPLTYQLRASGAGVPARLSIAQRRQPIVQASNRGLRVRREMAAFARPVFQPARSHISFCRGQPGLSLGYPPSDEMGRRFAAPMWKPSAVVEFSHNGLLTLAVVRVYGGQGRPPHSLTPPQLTCGPHLTHGPARLTLMGGWVRSVFRAI